MAVVNALASAEIDEEIWHDVEIQLGALEAQQEPQYAPGTDRSPGDGLCVAYFCAEYGITEALPIYSGGLGVLAGDHLKSAHEHGD